MTNTEDISVLQTDDHSRQLSFVERLLIWTATAIIAAAVFNSTPLQSANDRSRWATVWSLVERKTFQIDEIDSNPRWSTIDKVRYRNNASEPWHFYSSKPPLLSVIVSGLYAVERATLGFGLLTNTALVTRLLLFVVNVVPFWFAIRSLGRTLLLLQAPLATRIFVLATAGFGSILNPYLTTLNNHTPAAACAMFSIAAAVRILQTRRTSTGDQRARDFACLGFFAALTCCFELPAAQMGLAAFILAAIVCRKKTVIAFAPAAILPLAAFFATNALVTGGFKPFYATYGTETYEYVHNGIPSYWLNPKDLDANKETTPVYLFHCVLGHHGLISLSPWFLLTMAGWLLATKRAGDHALKIIVFSGAIMTVITLSFYLTRTQNYNYGGNSVGLRWMIWLSPFWWIALIPALTLITTRPRQIIVALLLAISVASANWSLNRPWKASWLFEQMELAGLIDYRTPIAPFASPHGAVLGKLPTAIGVTATFVSSDQEQVTLTIAEDDVLVFQRSSPNGPNGTLLPGTAVRISLDRDRWTDHGAVRNSIDASGEVRQAEMFLTGFSEKLCRTNRREFDATRFPIYGAVGERWIPSIKNADSAWSVKRGVCRIILRDPQFGDLMHRCEVHYCDDLPFGVLGWKTTVTSMATGEVVSAVTWIAAEM